MMQKNTITVTSDKITQPFNFAFAADFHDGNVDEALALMQGCDAPAAMLVYIHRIQALVRQNWHGCCSSLCYSTSPPQFLLFSVSGGRIYNSS